MTATLSRQTLGAGPLDGELHARLDAAAARARALLGTGSGAGADEGVPVEARSLRRLIDALSERLAQSQGERGTAVREQEAALERLRHRYDTRFEALAGVHRAIDELRTITSPASMLAQAPAELCVA